ncbi:hypothetical protein HYV50_01105 [Candidatus Pacearchaeota archaeon]|nr:hypothetical protein [Candidatus Pacearchaeota archaeon]
MQKNKKRGASPAMWFFIITTITLVIGFLAVLIFLGKIDLAGKTEEEICRLSVLSRATTPESAQSLVPLKCTTEKICLSTTDEDCSQFLGEKNVEKIKLPSDEKQAAKKIEEISANAMYDCWSIMGKGKIDIFGTNEGSLTSNIVATTFSVSEIHPKCVICSRIAFAEDLKKEKEILEKINLKEYLEKEKIPGQSITYLQAFTDSQINAFPTEIEQSLVKDEPKTTDQMAFVFMQIIASDKTPIEQAIQAGSNTGIAIGGSLLLNPLGKIISVATLKVTAPLAITGTLLSGGLAYYQAEKNQAIAATHCGKFTSTKTERYGCSLITPLDYNNVTIINDFCNGGIESLQ